MDENENKSSEESDSRSSSVMFDMPVLPYLPRRYDRTLIVPSILSERQSNPYAVDIKLPPLKFSTTEPTSEEEDFLALNPPTTEREVALFKQKFNRLRVTLSVRFFIFKISHMIFLSFQTIFIHIRLSSQRYV